MNILLKRKLFKFFIIFSVLSIIFFLSSFFYDDKLSFIRVKKYVDLLESEGVISSFLNYKHDFVIYSIQVYLVKIITFNLINLRTCAIIVNSFWISLVLVFANLPSYKTFGFPKLCIIYLYLMPTIYLWGPVSLRESFVFALLVGLLSLISHQLTFDRFRFKFISVFILLLFYFFYRTRTELAFVLIPVFLFVLTNRYLFKEFNFLNIPREILNIKKPKKSFLLAFLFLPLLICFSIIQLGSLQLDRLNPDTIENNILSKVTSYQEIRLSRGVLGSESDVMNEDEYKKAGFFKRYLIQSTNLILTPIKFEFTKLKILSLLDSFLSILIVLLLLNNNNYSKKNLSYKIIKKYRIISEVYIVSAITIFLAFSLFVNNGGTAIRYKPFWLYPLIVGLMYFNVGEKFYPKDKKLMNKTKYNLFKKI